MARIGGLGCQHRLGVAGQAQPAGAVALIGEGEPPHLCHRLRRHGHEQSCGEVVIAPGKLGLMRVEAHGELIPALPHGLPRYRPGRAGIQILDVDPHPPGIEGRIGPPAGESDGRLLLCLAGHVAAVAPAGSRDHQVVASVGEHVGRRQGRSRRNLPRGQRHLFLRLPHDADVLLRGLLDGCVRGYLFLEQQLDAPHPGVTVEGLHQHVFAQVVDERRHHHSLVMDHVAAHDSPLLAQGQARTSVIHRVVEAIVTEHPVGDQAPDVLDHRLRVQAEGQQRSVGRDHQILSQSPLPPQARDTEAPVLVVHRRIEAIVGRFGDPPGHAGLARVGPLSLDNGFVALRQEGVRIPPHEEIGHEVLEHTAVPGEQGVVPVDAGEGPAQVQPMALRHLAPGDGDETRRPGLGGEQIVVIPVQRLHVHAVAQEEDLALLVEEEVKGHGVGSALSMETEVLETDEQRARRQPRRDEGFAQVAAPRPGRLVLLALKSFEQRLGVGFGLAADVGNAVKRGGRLQHRLQRRPPLAELALLRGRAERLRSFQEEDGPRQQQILLLAHVIEVELDAFGPEAQIVQQIRGEEATALFAQPTQEPVERRPVLRDQIAQHRGPARWLVSRFF